MKKTAFDMLRITICLAAIAWLARGVSGREVASMLQHADWPLLGAAIVLFTLTPVFQALRLKLMLASRGMNLDATESLRLALAGNFLNYAAPLGSTAGDVYKAVRLARFESGGIEAAVIVMADRAIGLATLLGSVALISLAGGSESPLTALRGHMLVGCGVMGLGGILVAAVPAGVFVRWETRCGSRAAAARAVRVASTIHRLTRTPTTLLWAVLTTLAIQVAAAASFLCVALSLGFHVSPSDWTQLYAYFSAGEIVKALPGPPQGLGTMELAYATLFKGWAGPAQIVAAAMGIRLVGLVCSLPGAAMIGLAGAAAKPGPVRAGVRPALMATATQS